MIGSGASGMTSLRSGWTRVAPNANQGFYRFFKYLMVA
jgi:hypothetical protein